METLYYKDYSSMITATNPPQSWYQEGFVRDIMTGTILRKESPNYNYLNSMMGSIEIDSNINSDIGVTFTNKKSCRNFLKDILNYIDENIEKAEQSEEKNKEYNNLGYDTAFNRGGLEAYKAIKEYIKEYTK